MKRALLFVALLIAPATLFAQWHGPDVPDSISFQGYLTDTDGDPVPSGNYNLLFKMYKGSSKVWEQNHLNVPVDSGRFSVILSGTVSYPLDTVAFNEPIDLGITVNGGDELSPRTPLTSSAYALGIRGLYAVGVEVGALEGVNVIGGASNNFVEGGVVGATVSGGGGVNSAVGYPDSVTGHWSTVGGGYWNTAGDFAATVGGGGNNKAKGFAATVGGGIDNVASYQGVVAGGSGNNATGASAFVGGGGGNKATESNAAIGGGTTNTASGNSSFVGSGLFNEAGGWASTVSGGESNEAAASYSVVAGGQQDTASGDWSTVSGGYKNSAVTAATVAGGRENKAKGAHSSIGGGSFNVASSASAVIAGGEYNNATMIYSTVSGGSINTASGGGATVGGGSGNTASGDDATVGGGASNVAGGKLATVPGGSENEATRGWSFAAGQAAHANHSGTFVWADSANNSSGVPFASTDENQFLIRASGGVGIGTNTPKAHLHVAGNIYTRGHVYLYAFEGDGSDGTAYLQARDDATSTIDLRLRTYNAGSVTEAVEIQADGKVGLMNTSPGFPLEVGTDGTNGGGAHVTAGGVWTDASSRTFKTNFEKVNSRSVLERLAALPIATWEYKESNEGRHMGPVAEDFHEAFGLGDNERYISGTDARGVSMAAIQGLYELVKEQQALIVNLTARLEELENR